MVKKKIAALLVLCFLVSQITLASAQSPGDYHHKFWGGGLHVWLSYPEEASPGDNIEIEVHIISGKFARGNQIEEVELTISVLTNSSQVTLFDDIILQNTYLPNGDDYSQTISLSLPSDARWFTSIQIDTVSYQQDWTNRQEAHITLDAVQIRDSTYYDLEDQIDELQAYSTQLGEQITSLLEQLGEDPGNQPVVIDSTLGEDFQSLQDAYDELQLEFDESVAEVNALQMELEASYTENDDYVEQLEAEISELTEEAMQLYEEIDMMENESEEMDDSTQSQGNSQRNLLIATNLVTLIAVIVLLMRLRGS